MSAWRRVSERVIRQALAEAKDAGLDAAATDKLISSRYPFGERRYHPYTMWLKVKRELTTAPGETPKSAAAARERERLAAWNAGQPLKASEERTNQ